MNTFTTALESTSTVWSFDATPLFSRLVNYRRELFSPDRSSLQKLVQAQIHARQRNYLKPVRQSWSR